jgi:hypothetical protein
MTAADVEELTRSTRELMLKEVIDMARDKSALVVKEKTGSATQDQEALTAGKEHAVVKNPSGGIEASQATGREKRTFKL